MYFIRKYADCRAVHKDDKGQSQPLTERVKWLVLEEFGTLQDQKVASLFLDEMNRIKVMP